MLASGLLAFIVAACTRSTVPIQGTLVPVEPATPDANSDAPPPPDEVYRTSGTYAVVWIPEGETLKLRAPAGIAGSVVGELEYDTRGLRVSGNTTSLGSSLWVEVIGPDGDSGWVNGWNVAEEVSSSAFCADTQILDLLGRFTEAFLDRDAEALAGMVNPKRGLVLRHDWWNPEVVIRPSEVENLYLSREDRAWGTLSGGTFEILGSFDEIYSPLLLDVLSQTPTAVCGEIPSGVTSRPVVWPGEYANLNFYAFHRASPVDGNRFDWRTIVFGFEFVEGMPYLTLLVHYHGDI